MSLSLAFVNHVPTGALTPAPKQWVYKARLVDKWGFLAKTLLILERLKGISQRNSGTA